MVYTFLQSVEKDIQVALYAFSVQYSLNNNKGACQLTGYDTCIVQEIRLFIDHCSEGTYTSPRCFPLLIFLPFMPH